MFWSKKDFLKAQDADLPSASPVLRVSDYLAADRILFFNQKVEKEKVIRQLADLLPVPNLLTAEQAILARENQGATFLLPEVVVPHARMAGLQHLVASIGICPAGIQGMDSVRLFLLFVSPQDALKNHLAFLASLSGLFQTDGLVDRLVQGTSSQQVFDEIRRVE